MGEFLRQVILGDFMIFMIMLIAVVLITAWAMSVKATVGYILGWLFGILLMILLSALIREAPDRGDESIPHFLVLFFPAMIGLATGFGLVTLIRRSRDRSGRDKRPNVRRPLAIAITLSLTIAAGYLTLITPYAVRLTIAIVVLTIIVGGLFGTIITRRPPNPEEEARQKQAENERQRRQKEWRQEKMRDFRRRIGER